MPNSYVNQTLVKRELTRKLKPVESIAKYIDFSYTKLFGAESNTGPTQYVRIPSQYLSNDEGIGVDHSLAAHGVDLPTQWQAKTEPVVKLGLMHKWVARYETSMEDFVYNLTEAQNKDRHSDAIVISIQDHISKSLALDLLASVGQSIGTPGTIDSGANYMSRIAKSRVLLNQTSGYTANRRKLLINPLITANLSVQQQTQFHSGAGIDKTFKDSQFGDYAGFSIDENYTIPTINTPAGAGTDLTYTFPSTQPSAGTGAITGSWPLVAWQQFWQIVVPTSWAEGTVVPAGTKFSFSGVNAVQRAPFLTDTGVLKTFTVSSPATVASDKSVTLTVTEPLIATGPYQNVSALPVSGTNKLNFLGLGVPAAASIAFGDNALIGASPIMPAPDNVKVMRLNVGGLNILLQEDHMPGNNQTFLQGYCLYGFANIYQADTLAIY